MERHNLSIEVIENRGVEIAQNLRIAVDRLFEYRLEPVFGITEAELKRPIVSYFSDLVDWGMGDIAIETVKPIVIGDIKNSREFLIEKLRGAVNAREYAHEIDPPLDLLHLEDYLDGLNKALSLATSE